MSWLDARPPPIQSPQVGARLLAGEKGRRLAHLMVGLLPACGFGAESPVDAAPFVSPTLGTMEWIPPGTFTMGSPMAESDNRPNQTQHSVTLTTGFWLMEHEVSQAEWISVMGSNPSYFADCGPTCPVDQVTWFDAVRFCERVSARDGVSYRLPTAAEWERAAQGSVATATPSYDELERVGWYVYNAGGTTHPGCGKERNGYGLCDMLGNVEEWNSDWWSDLPEGRATDPLGPSSGTYHVTRGGCWNCSWVSSPVSFYQGDNLDYRSKIIGLRLARGWAP